MPPNVCKGHWEFRYTFHFIWQPAQIHIHVQLCLAGTSLYQRCLLPDEIPSAPNSPYQASALRRTVPIFCQSNRKDGFYRKKKNRPLRTVAFHHMKINALRLLQNFLTNFSPYRNPLILPVNRTRIKSRKPDQLCTVQVLMMHIDSVN